MKKTTPKLADLNRLSMMFSYFSIIIASYYNINLSKKKGKRNGQQHAQTSIFTIYSQFLIDASLFNPVQCDLTSSDWLLATRKFCVVNLTIVCTAVPDGTQLLPKKERKKEKMHKSHSGL